MLTICDAETYLQFIKDDPVRPDLFEDDVQRFNNKEGFYVFADIDVDEKTGATEVNAILCAVICPFIMQDEELLRELAASKGEFINMLSELFEGEFSDESPPIASIFTPYSLWSYKKGSGKKLINNLLEAIPERYPNITHVITMSPPTKMAMNFHLGNGAILFSPNVGTINYEYKIEQVTLH